MSDLKYIPQSTKIKRILYNHQLVSIKNMEDLETVKQIVISDTEIINTTFGILADVAGYGKTTSMLGLIARNNKWSNPEEPYVNEIKTGTPFLSRVRTEYYKKVNCSVVVLNSILLGQWEKELCYTDLRYKKICSKKDIDNIEIDIFTDIVLCDSQYYQLFCSKFPKNAFKRIIIDEPSNITKLSTDLKYMCDFLWFITATPYQIFMKNKYSQIINIDDTTFSRVIVKNPDQFVVESFKMPPVRTFTYTCSNILYEILKEHVKPNARDLLLAENIPGLIELFGGKKGSYESILNLIFEKKKRKIKELELIITAKKDEKETSKLIERKNNLESELLSIHNNFKKILVDNSCSICLEKFKSPCLATCCQNIFCANCITCYLKSNTEKCPLCRSSISIKNIICITNFNDSESKGGEGEKIQNSQKMIKTKNQTILDIINKNINGKFIIYSNYCESFDYIKKYLDDNKISHTELKGMKSQKEKNLDLYKNGNTSVIFLTTLQYSAGIELINTTDIILYHEMEVAVLTQIIGRAIRIGRKAPLNLHILN